MSHITSSNVSNTASNDRKNLWVVNLSLLANVLLAVSKTSIGIVGNSPALLADGINSIADVVYITVVRVFMRLAGKPPDRDHPFGHRQLESVAAIVVGAFVMVTGFAIFWEAIRQVMHLFQNPHPGSTASMGALHVALMTILLKIVLTVFSYSIAARTKSIAVLAIARDHRNDILSITAATVGILCSRMGYHGVDPAAAAFVAVIITWTGVTILRESSADLMNVLPGKTVRDDIRDMLRDIEGIDSVEEIRVHRIGMYLMVSIVIGVDGEQTVAQGDKIASRVERTLYDNVEYLRHVSVHYHPSRKSTRRG